MNTAAIPPLILALLYWLHLLATIAWIGGLAAMAWLVLPAAHKTLDSTAYSRLLARLQARLQQIAWISLAVLIVTGLFQMSASPFYTGFLQIGNTWSVAILAKHLVVGLLILTSAYLTWGLLPAINRLALLKAAGRPIPEAQSTRLERRETWLLRTNLALSILILLLTAVARTAS